MTAKNSTAATPAPTDPADTNVGSDAGGAAENKGLLSQHKGKLAIGVAATLGVMIYYNWRQKQLSKEDPEAYARLQRVKDSIKADTHAKEGHDEKHRKAAAGKSPGTS